MKNILLIVISSGIMFAATARQNEPVPDTIGVPLRECPGELVAYVNTDSLKTKAILLLFNESLHPLGRYEFFDSGSMVRYLHIPIRMNRCSLLYIDSGVHNFHTMYQQLKVPVYFRPGKIYMARLFTRTIWPIGGISIIKKNEQGEDIEYAAVLFEYVDSHKAAELYGKMKKKKVVVNE